jgi:hypothetical protein
LAPQNPKLKRKIKSRHHVEETHWKLKEQIENLKGTHLELKGKVVGTHWSQGREDLHITIASIH